MKLSNKPFLPVAMSALLSVSLTACFHDDTIDEEHHDSTIDLTLTGDEVVDITKAHANTANGGTATLMFHETEEELAGTVTFTGTAPTSVEVREGFAGQSAAAATFTLEVDAADSSIFTIPDEQAIDPELVESGSYYLLATYGDGTTTRSQITAHGIEISVARFEAVSGVTTTGSGFAGITLNTDSNVVTSYVSIVDVTGISNVHIHIEDATTPTPVGTLVTLEVDNTAAGVVYMSPTDLTEKTLTHDERMNIAAGRWYVNVHTTTNSAGEIRADLGAIEMDHH